MILKVSARLLFLFAKNVENNAPQVEYLAH